MFEKGRGKGWHKTRPTLLSYNPDLFADFQPPSIGEAGRSRPPEMEAGRYINSVQLSHKHSILHTQLSTRPQHFPLYPFFRLGYLLPLSSHLEHKPTTVRSSLHPNPSHRHQQQTSLLSSAQSFEIIRTPSRYGDIAKASRIQSSLLRLFLFLLPSRSFEESLDSRTRTWNMSRKLTVVYRNQNRAKIMRDRSACE